MTIYASLPPRHFKDEIFRQFARIGKALASPKRVELLDVLSQGPRTVEVLAREAECSVANTSRHLQVLRGARLVEGDRSGLFVTYRVSDERVSAFLRQFRLLAESRLMRPRRRFWENASGSSRWAAGNCFVRFEPGRSRSLTCVRAKNMRRGICRERFRFPWTISGNGCAGFRKIGGSSPIAGGRIACFRSRRSNCCEGAAIGHNALISESTTGVGLDLKSKPWPPEELRHDSDTQSPLGPVDL